MFKIEQIHDLAGRVIGEIAKRDRTPEKDSRNVESALAELTRVLKLGECQDYLVNYGKLAWRAKPKGDTQENPYMLACAKAIDCATMLELIYKNRQFYHPRLHTYVSVLRSMAETMQSNLNEVEKGFLSNT